MVFPTDTSSPPANLSLSLAYVELGAAITASTVEVALQRVTDLAVERVVGAEWASITLLHDGGFRTAAATAPSAEAADRMQYELGEGPCVAAVRTTSAHLVDHLRADERWPTFAARVGDELGVSSILALRLGLDVDDLDDTVACLNIYSTRAGSFDGAAVVVATLLAAHASTAIISSQYQYRVEQLERALATNREIGMAMGILMFRHKVTEEQAFALMRTASQETNRKLRAVAFDIVATGQLAPPEIQLP